MTRPLKIVGCNPGVLAEFQDATDTLDDDTIALSTILQYEGSLDHENIANNGISTGHSAFPQEYSYAVNNVPTNILGSILTTHLSLSHVVVTPTPYILGWSYSYSRNNTGSDVIIQLVDVGGVNGNLIDPEIVHYQQVEMKDGAGASRVGGTGTNQANSASGFIQLDLPVGTQDFDLQINSSAGAFVLSSIWDARLMLRRVG